MDIKQEPLDDPGLESIDVKEEPLLGEPVTLFKDEPNVCDYDYKTQFLQKVKVKRKTEYVNHIQSQINQTKNSCLYSKNDSVFAHGSFSRIKLETPEINESEVQAKEFCLVKSDIVKIKQEIDIKYELLTDECDLPIVKNEADFLNEPCTSQQLLQCLQSVKNATRKKRKSRNQCQKSQEEECKNKWNGIQDSIRRARKKIKEKSGQAVTSTNKYKYEGILTFLIPHLAERKGLSNIPDEDDADSPETANESQQQNSIQETQQPQDVSNAEDTTEPSPLPPATTPISRVSAEKRPSDSGHKRKVVNTAVKSQESALSQLMAYILSKKEAKVKNRSNTKSQNSEHPVDSFLAGIAPSLKSLDPVRLLAAKGKIFNVVQEFELQQLRANSQQKTTMSYVHSSTSSAQTFSASTHSQIARE